MLQSVVIAGGYGTGREVVEFFSNQGMNAGIKGFTTALVCMACVFALCLEISRVFRVYDYRSFFRILLGPAWFLFEVLGVVMFMLIFAVIGSAAGEVIHQELGLHPMAGVSIMLLCVTVIVFYGRELVTRLLAYWSLFLYLVFFAYLACVFVLLDQQIAAGFSASTDQPGWLSKGLQYTFYNATAIPVILYCAMAIETRRQAIIAGCVGAVIAIAPGLMLHVSFAAHYPAILEEGLPVYAIFALLDIEVLKIAYLVMLFGTFIETGAGNLQGVMERIDNWLRETDRAPLARHYHAIIAAVAMLIAGALSHLGIVTLIAEGYGTLAWGYLFVFIIPLFTVGIYRLYQGA